MTAHAKQNSWLWERRGPSLFRKVPASPRQPFVKKQPATDIPVLCKCAKTPKHWLSCLQVFRRRLEKKKVRKCVRQMVQATTIIGVSRRVTSEVNGIPFHAHARGLARRRAPM